MSDETLFEKVASLSSPSDRAAFLDRECAGRPDLRREIEELLAAQDGAAHDFLRPPDDQRATVGYPSGSPETTPDVGLLLARRYKLVEVIGEGGMGTVWMAHQTEPVRRTVAVKLIKSSIDLKAVLARFETERQAQAIMDHPNIAKVLDAGASPDGRPFLVMDLVRGLPITEYCDAHKLTVRERLKLFVPVCQAIQHAHQKGIIHRDIKPRNVLVAQHDDRPVPVVIDFGVAKALGAPLTENTFDTGFDKVVGTPQYMSPEQASFNQLDIDTRSDIYSLGILLYELLAGSPPFSHKELVKAGLLKMYHVIREQEPPKPSTKLSTAEGLATIASNRNVEPKRLTGLVRGELDWIVMKALEKDRDRRYETANSFAKDVDRYLNNEPVEACPPTLGYRLRKYWRRHRAGVIVAAFAVLVGLALVSLAAYGYDQRRAAALARERLTAAEERTALEKEYRAREELRTKLALAQARVNDTAYGRQIDARRILTQDVPRLLSQIHDTELADQFRLDARSIHARTFAYPDFAPRRPAGDILTLADIGRHWPVALHPNGQSMTIGTPGDPIYWVRGDKATIPPEYRPNSGKRPATIRLPKLAYSTRGTYLAYAPNAGGVQIWDSHATRRLGDLQDIGAGSFEAFDFDATESTIWACRKDGHFRSWSLQNFSPTSPWRSPDLGKQVPSTAAFDTSGKFLALGTEGGDLLIVDREGKTIRSIRGSTTKVEAIAWSPTEKLLAAGFRDGSVRLWREDGTLLHVFRPFQYSARRLAFHPTRPWLFAGGLNDAPVIFDLGSKQRILTAATTGVHDFTALAADGTTIAETTTYAARFGDLVFPGPMMRELTGHESSIERLTWCKDNYHFVTLDAECKARVWSVNRPTPVFQVALPAGGFYSQNAAIALSHDARYLAYAGAGDKGSPVRVIDITTGAVVVEDVLPSGFEEMVAAGNDSFLLAREEYDPGKRTLSTVLWDIVAGKRPSRRHVIRPSDPGDVGLYFQSRLSADGRYLAWVGPRYSKAGHRLEIREVATGRLIYLHRWEQSAVDSEGPAFAFGKDDAELWFRDRSDTSDYRRIPLSGNGEPQAATGFTQTMSANGEWYLVNEALDKRWARSGKEIAMLFRTGEVQPRLNFDNWSPATLYFSSGRARFSPNSQFLAVGSNTGIVELMHLPSLKREIDAYDRLLTNAVKP